MAQFLKTKDTDFEKNFQSLLGAKREMSADVRDSVADIIQDVITYGDNALFDLTEKYDRFNARNHGLLISQEEINTAIKQVSDETYRALELAAKRIHNFHTRQLPDNIDYIDETGTRLGQTWKPVSSVGLYVPGGLARDPSSV